MLFKHLISITLALASFSTMADTPDTAQSAEKTADTAATSDKTTGDTTTDKKTDSKSSPTDKATDTSAATKGDQITVTVTIDADDVAGIGYKVDGKDSGKAGSSHQDVGPSNKSYTFGYRKTSNIKENITCGTATLTKDSKVTLIDKGGSCSMKVE